MSTNIILIRHGETPWNAERRLQGHIDIGLNANGQSQADALGRALAGEPLAAIVASDLDRAHRTALAVAVHHPIAVQNDVLLRERCYGAFEGLLYAEIEQRYPRAYRDWQAREIDSVMPSGAREAESFRRFYERIVAAIGVWAERYRGRSIALVAHGGVLECAYRAAVGMSLDSPRDFPVRNASINRFTFSGGKLALTHWGDVGHLAAPAMDELA